MAQYSPKFDISEYELRGYTNPYLSEEQKTAVEQVEERVNGQLDFVAQMLGWNGPNYWDNLVTTVDEKRQVLQGTYYIYKGFTLPTVLEYRNWDNTIIIEPIPELQTGQEGYEERVFLGDKIYPILDIKNLGDKYSLSIGELDDEFFALISANEPLRLDIPSTRVAPAERPYIGVSGDYTFVCGNDGTNLILYPGYDDSQRFPFKFPVLYAGATYYFDRPIYLSDSLTLDPIVKPEYDLQREKWSLSIPQTSGMSAFLAQASSSQTQSSNYWLQVKIQQWTDPSDWKGANVLSNFTGIWGNKGGYLPMNHVFDSLSIHGFNERVSLYLPKVEQTFLYNDIVNYVYNQKVNVSPVAPSGANPGDLWWDDNKGQLSVWLDNNSCGAWVNIDYRQQLRQLPVPELTFADLSSFQAEVSNILLGTTVRIVDATGLSDADGVIDLNGTLSSPVTVIMYKVSEDPYWKLSEFNFPDVASFGADAALVPQQITTKIRNATGLTGTGTNYKISNLKITVAGDYEVLLLKVYRNDNWEVYPDSILKFIADSALFNSPTEGELWWDFANTDPATRAAAIYYENNWVGINQHPQSGPPSPALNLGTVLFYCDGVLLTSGVSYSTDDYRVSYTDNNATGGYDFVYEPRSFKGTVQFPKITISDNITSTYQADISNLAFSGLQYYMSPNVANAESTLRVWKPAPLQVADSMDLINQNNFLNPLQADINNGPALEHWERYFIRLPLEYGRNEDVWQKVALVCKNFAYWGTTLDPEFMKCPPEDSLVQIYEELFLYDEPLPDYTYVYAEPYLYSNTAYSNSREVGDYLNSGSLPTIDIPTDGFDEAELIEYEPLHSRRVNVTSAPGSGFGDWEGQYVNVNPCVETTGFLETDLLNNAVEPVAAPIWDASIYKFAPTCDNDPESYSVDSNHYKICYAYFVADASAAEEPVFDVSLEASWRQPVTQPRSLYLTPPR